jgi:hypothetical protein
MGANHRPKDLSDLLRYEANLQVNCRACGRSGTFHTPDVIAYFRSKGWNTAWGMVACRFRCEGLRRQGCLGEDGADREAAGAAAAPADPI